MTGFPHIRGQARAVGLLRRAMAAGKVPHAYLFAGPAGVGKATTALALAAAHDCEQAPGEGCGACAACEKLATGTHPDLFVLTPTGAGNFITVDQVRDLNGRLGFAPHEGRIRLVIVEDADRLRVEAANAFLKTLEEPPDRTHFVLVTAAPEQLLVTVRSRCQRVRFQPLEPEAIAQILEARGVAPERSRAAAALAEGSASRAYELAEGDALERRHERAGRLRAAVRTSGWKAAIDAANELAQEKDELRPTLDLLALWYRDAAAVAAGLGAESLVHRDRVGELRDEATGHTPAGLARRARAVLEAQDALLGFANPQLALERMILALREGAP